MHIKPKINPIKIPIKLTNTPCVKNIKIICSESLNYDTFDFSSNNVDFIYESNEFFLDSLIETYGDSII